MSLRVEGLTFVGTCDCGVTLVVEPQWRTLTGQQRAWLRRAGYHRHGGRGLCQPCACWHRYHGTLIDHERKTVPHADALDAWHNDDHSPHDSRSARIGRLAPRLGMSTHALRKALDRGA